MNYRERMKKAVECPQFGNINYGEWGALNRNQRIDIKRLLDEMDRADEYIKTLYFKNMNLQSKLDKINKFCDYSFKNPWYVSEKELLGKIIDISKDDDMNEATIHSQIEEVIEKIKNKNDMQEVIDDINKISKNLYELPLYHDYIEMVVLFNETYNTCLVFNGKGE